MFDFEFYNPTQILFGKGTVAKIAQIVPSNAKVLIIYGGESAKQNGVLTEVVKALGEREYYEFGGVEANPTYETLLSAIKCARDNNVDYLLAVGGGSVIDGTKFVAAAVLFKDEPWQILVTKGQAITQALPFGVVLTLPATGSEMNCSSVITRESTKTKLVFASKWVFPQFAVLDPEKTYTLPKRQLANGVIDSFTHIMEQYLTYPVDGHVQDRFAEGLLQTLIEIGPNIVNESAEYHSRANLMWTATMALNGLIGAGVPQDWSTHFIGHELTALYHIDHAQTLAIILPSMLEIRKESKKDKLLQYAERVWHITDGDCDERIEQAILKTREFFESLGIKTHLSDYGIALSDIDSVIEQLKNHGMTQLGERQAITLDVSRQILNASI